MLFVATLDEGRPGIARVPGGEGTMGEHHGAPGPYETEAQAEGGVAHIKASPLASWSDGNLRLLEDACRAAGVELGAYDHAVLLSLAGDAPAEVAVVAGLITRAAERSPLESLMGPAGVAQPGGGMGSGSSNWPPS